MRKSISLLAVLLLLALAAAAGYYLRTPVIVNYVSTVGNPTTPENDLSALYDKISKSVVSISAQQTILGTEYHKEGSGFFIDKRHVITNQHVIDSVDSIEVSLDRGEKLTAEVTGSDVYSDLAVLELEREVNITPLALGNSSTVLPGTPVAAFGSPFGLHGSIASGIISAKGRMLKTEDEFLIVNVLQTDAPLNPGNSGGPLVDMNGLVIGVTVAKEGDNVGFAIPSNTVKRIVPMLIAGERYRHPWVGIVAQPVTKRLAKQLGLAEAKGMQVLQVNEGGPADNAGLRGSDKLRKAEKTQVVAGGDIITHINGVEMNSFTDLMNYLETETSAGQNITITYLRDGSSHTTTLTLGVRGEGE